MSQAVQPCKRLRLASSMPLPFRPRPLNQTLHRTYSRRRTLPQSNKISPLLSEFLASPRAEVERPAPPDPVADLTRLSNSELAKRAGISAPTGADAAKVDEEGNTLLRNYLLKRAQAQEQRAIAKRAPPTISAASSTSPSTSVPATAEPQIRYGDLAPNSLFSQIEFPDFKAPPRPGEDKRDAEAAAAKLDPQPSKRIAFERRIAIRAVRRRGHLSKAELIRQTERAITRRSAFWKTSVKKLGMLARQIAGKTLDDAIVQMQYSKKAIAREVLKHLQQTKADAVVKYGMGLGSAQGTQGEPITVRLKDGRAHRVKDHTRMYIDEAWVGRGAYGFGIDYRARGRSHRLRLPTTSLTVVLKEEATRVRQHEQREAKHKIRPLWTALPDRPVFGQRQYYSW